MSVHDERHEAILQRWTTREELTTGDRALLERCETCRQRRSEIEAVAAELEELGSTEREAEIEDALRGPAPEWEERALAALERSMRGDARPPRRPRWWLAAGLAAAAAVLAAVFLFGPGGSGPGPVEPVWLGQELQMSPAGEVEHADTFSWVYETPSLGRYEIALYLPGESTPFQTATTYETRWSPDPSDPLPAHFLWEVRAFDGDREVAFDRAEVFVSPL